MSQNGYDFNNNSNPDNNPGPAYTGLSDNGAANTKIQRKGPVTFYTGTGNLAASRVWAPDSIANQGWKPGDIIKAAAASHTGAGFTITIQNIAGGVLATWPAVLANACELVFTGSDFVAVNPGQSTT